MRSSLKVGDSVRLSTTNSDGSVIAYWAKCYKILDNGKACIEIPKKIMSLPFPPYSSNRIVMVNNVLEASIKRANPQTVEAPASSPVKYEAELVLWSRVGHTPLTKRQGAYCDELARKKVMVAGVSEARSALMHLAGQTPYSSKGYYYIPALPNQNIRSAWVSF